MGFFCESLLSACWRVWVFVHSLKGFHLGQDSDLHGDADVSFVSGVQSQ